MTLFKRTFAFIVMVAISFTIVTQAAYSAVLPLPANTVEGINYIDDNTVVLVLLAPGKAKAEVTGSFNNWALAEMNKTPDGERFWIQLNNLNAGDEYIYQYLVDDNIRIADPFAEKILDPWNDKHIPESVYPNLIKWEDGDKGLASVFQTAQPEYQWQVSNFDAPLKHHLVIYELLIRDFTAQHSFQSVIDSIQYLKNLGINAIELLPVNEFDGNISWGYNPAFYFAVDKYYGTKNKLKELIDVAHQNGIAIILDMVYNHSMNSHPLVSLYWDEDNGRPASNNPWYNAEAPHTCIGWGNDFNHESQYTRNFFDRVNKHWLEEYNIDGFRYDFTKGLTQKYTAPRWEGDGDCGTSDYDGSRVYNIKRMADKVWEVKNDAYIILEHWSSSEEEDELTSYGNGMLTWKRVDHQYKEVISGHDLDNQTFYGSQVDTRVTFMESHDENRIMVQNHDHGNVSWDGSYNIKNTSTGLDRVAAGAAFLYTVPGPKMIWMFGEQGYDYDINYCITDGSVTEDCRTGPKPLVWTEYMQNQDRKDLYNTMSELIKLRTQNEVFTHGYFTMEGEGAIRQIKITHETMDVLIMGNFDVYTQTVTDPMFSKEGTWYNYFSGQDYDYTVGNQYVLAPGQWELFTSVPIDPDNILKPTNLSATANGNNVNLTWVDNAGNETAYEVLRSQQENTGFTTVATLEADASSYTDENLLDGVYYYKVRATGENGKTSDFSNTANVRVGEIPGFDIHFKNTDNWSQVNIYLYDYLADAPIEGWNWPGKSMTQELSSPWYKYTVTEDVQVGIVINNGSGLKTVNLTRTTDGWYDFSTKQWHDACPGDCPVEQVPTLSVNPQGQEFVGSIQVSLSATNNGAITYTLNGDDPKTGNPYNGPINITNDTRLRAIALNNTGYSNEIDETYTKVVSQCDTIYFYNVNNWSTVKIYLFNENGTSLAGWDWPGKNMTQVGTSKWYYYVNCETVNTGIVFNNGSGDQLGDEFANSGWFYSNGQWYNSCPGECPGEQPTGLTLHCKKPSNWSTVYLYFWNTTGATVTTTWPGEPMTDTDGDGWYDYTISGVSCANVIFNNNGSPQTDNLYNICTESWYDNGWVSSQKSATSIANTVNDLSKPYPNPFTSEISISVSDKNSTVAIEIIDLKGQVQYSTTMNSGNGTLKVQPELNSGVYLMRVSNASGLRNYKIVRQ